MADSVEQRLIRKILAGDESAFRNVFRHHSPAMFGVARRILGGDAADAEDAVQEAWLRAVRSLVSFRGDSALQTWLVGIAVRCALEIGRRRRSTTTVEDWQPTSAPASGDRLDLERVIAALADGYRHVLVLHDVYGYTHAEIAGLLGIEEGTSKSQLSRARALVRRALAPVSEDCVHDR